MHTRELSLPKRQTRLVSHMYCWTAPVLCRKVGLLVGGDVAVLLLFAAIGRLNHGEVRASALLNSSRSDPRT